LRSIASRSIAFGFQLPSAFNIRYSIFDIQSFSIASRSIACGVQLLAAFNSFAFKGLIASGVQ
jgi:hypothetical protein